MEFALSDYPIIFINFRAHYMTTFVHIGNKSVLTFFFGAKLLSEKLAPIQNVVPIFLIVRFIVKIWVHTTPQPIHLIVVKFEVVTRLYE